MFSWYFPEWWKFNFKLCCGKRYHAQSWAFLKRYHAQSWAFLTDQNWRTYDMSAACIIQSSKWFPMLYRPSGELPGFLSESYVLTFMKRTNWQVTSLSSLIVPLLVFEKSLLKKMEVMMFTFSEMSWSIPWCGI